jgi:hypothetical protein
MGGYMYLLLKQWFVFMFLGFLAITLQEMLTNDPLIRGRLILGGGSLNHCQVFLPQDSTFFSGSTVTPFLWTWT